MLEKGFYLFWKKVDGVGKHMEVHADYIAGKARDKRLFLLALLIDHKGADIGSFLDQDEYELFSKDLLEAWNEAAKAKAAKAKAWGQTYMGQTQHRVLRL